jgi:hypothetical protein
MERNAGPRTSAHDGQECRRSQIDFISRYGFRCGNSRCGNGTGAFFGPASGKFSRANSAIYLSFEVKFGEF